MEPRTAKSMTNPKAKFELSQTSTAYQDVMISMPLMLLRFMFCPLIVAAILDNESIMFDSSTEKKNLVNSKQDNHQRSLYMGEISTIDMLANSIKLKLSMTWRTY